MMESNSALLIVDVQNDFCPGGALSIQDGDIIIPIINRLQHLFEVVIATQDWHPANHISFAVNHPGRNIYEVISANGISQVLWPVHCVPRSFGADFHPSLQTDRFRLILRKGTTPGLDSYSAFRENDRKTPTGLDGYLRSIGIESIYLCGLATDYCVLYSALDAISFGFDTNVIIDGCQGVDVPAGNVAEAVRQLKNNGIRIITASELLMNPGLPFSLALLADLYELTMMQGYHQTYPNRQAVFEMFFRRQPFDGGFSIFAGLAPLIDVLLNLEFRETDISYLRSLKIFSESFLEYLSNFRFSGDLWAMPEGSVVFPNEPLLRVRGTILEGQLIESIILNTINFQTLIATKSARVVQAANGGMVIEFGLRRAQGVDGAISATRAAYIGGASATSNVLGGALYGIPVRGTMAHSWIMSFNSEYEAFERYSELFSDNCVLLVDTYDTSKSGVPNAIRVLRGLKNKGYMNFGIRLDSGDLEYLSCRARESLDAAGLSEAKILASNELDEWVINQLVKNNSPIDGWGVGSKIVTADKDPFLTGVYKLVAKSDFEKMQPVMKISNDPDKITMPGIKNVLRLYDSFGMMLADLIYIESEERALMEKVNRNIPIFLQHPSIETDSFTLSAYSKARKLLVPVIRKGSRCAEPSTVQEARSNAIHELGSLDQTYKRLMNPHRYKVCISKKS